MHLSAKPGRSLLSASAGSNRVACCRPIENRFVQRLLDGVVDTRMNRREGAPGSMWFVLSRAVRGGSIVKIVRIGSRRAELRADFFNALNIPHDQNPNGTFGNANFGGITAILNQSERVVRFAGRFIF